MTPPTVSLEPPKLFKTFSIQTTLITLATIGIIGSPPFLYFDPTSTVTYLAIFFSLTLHFCILFGAWKTDERFLRNSEKLSKFLIFINSLQFCTVPAIVGCLVSSGCKKWSIFFSIFNDQQFFGLNEGSSSEEKFKSGLLASFISAVLILFPLGFLVTEYYLIKRLRKYIAALKEHELNEPLHLHVEE
ncbi:hypothetical protein CAEBREN_25301 [Caenorhabditis brenneri]|uniref:Uncharacterized protein n=1 Tax=Caenorhabditis brenneri TaxID=135651 RepID=G0PK45_CAEBE|nr:hypothetical protein CAEBREN_25301 [Caenorhabditis brenneri]